jgi:hypothetical protein
MRHSHYYTVSRVQLKAHQDVTVHLTEFNGDPHTVIDLYKRFCYYLQTAEFV